MTQIPHPFTRTRPGEWPINVCSSLRRSFREGYSWRDVPRDLLAGCVVGVVALPLSMALAIAVDVPPAHGLYTAIVAGLLIALLGGSPVQVSGPTAAFVVILAPIVSSHGLPGLMFCTVMAGVVLIVLGVARLGRLIEFVPYPVTTGFTAGIAIVIATLQMRDLLGLQTGKLPEHYLERVIALARALPTTHWPDAVVGLATLATLILITRFARRVPAALIGLPVGAILAFVLVQINPEWRADTIATRFGGIPQTLPSFGIPWLFEDPNHPPLAITLDTVRSLMLSSFAIALLGAIESLLSAVVAAGMSGKEHDPDGELIAQGVGNVVAPFFGGFAATGAIARTAANVRSGARSPIAAAVHAIFLVLVILLAAPILGYLPMASMAALLLIVAWNMSEVRHVVHALHVAPTGDKATLLLCLGLTVVFDMTIAVTVGVVFASLLFMQRMAAMTGVTLVSEPPEELKEPLPPHVMMYEVSGPLFFGAAQRAMSVLNRVARDVTIMVLDLRAVPVLDATGLVNLESTLSKLHAQNIYTIVAGVQSQPMSLMHKAGWSNREWLSFYPSFEEGLGVARNLAHLYGPGHRVTA